MNNFVFHNPTKIIFGEDSVDKLAEEINQYGKNILLCYGQSSIKRIGLYDKVIDQLESIDANVYELSGIEPNPKLSSVHEGVEICKKHDIDMILAVGGGSTIDAAKGIAVGAKYSGDVWDFYKTDKTIEAALPLSTILTLPATGTEMNGNSVVTNWETNEKLDIYSPHVFPKFSILDPKVTYTIPKEHTANGIIDIIIHVCEQYFSPTENTPLQDSFSESIIKTVIENTYKVLEDPNNYDARANIMWSGTWANNHLIGMGKVQDWASHMIEHEVSAISDVTHGAGLAVIHPRWMKYVVENNVDKFKKFAVRIWDIDPSGHSDLEVAQKGIDKLAAFYKGMGAPVYLEELAVGEEDISVMAENATRHGEIGGLKKLNQKDVEDIFKMCLK